MTDNETLIIDCLGPLAVLTSFAVGQVSARRKDNYQFKTQTEKRLIILEEKFVTLQQDFNSIEIQQKEIIDKLDLMAKEQVKLMNTLELLIKYTKPFDHNV